MKTLNPLLIMFLCLIGNIDLHAYTPVRRTELSNLCVRSIGQDTYGHIWIATANGLCKSFGNEYEIYFGDSSDTSTVPSNSVTGIMTDKDGWLMIATNMGICGLEKGTKIFHRFKVGNRDYYDFCGYGFIEYAGHLLCYGSNGLYVIDKKAKRMSHKVKIEGEAVTSAIIGPDSLLWLSNGTCLMAVDPTLKPTVMLNFSSSNKVKTIACTDNSLLLGTPKGVVNFNPKDQTITPTPIGTGTEVNHILTLPDGTHLIATGNRGVLVYDSSTGSVSNKYHNIDFKELQTAEINSLYPDTNGNIWVATFDRGEVLLSDRPRLFNVDRNVIRAFRNEFVTRATTDHRGNLWVGTRYNGLAVFNPVTKSKHYFNSHTSQALSSFCHDFVQEMAFDSRGRLWVGYNNSLIVCEPEPTTSSLTNIRQLNVVKKFPSFVNVVTITEDKTGRMWVGTDDSGLYIIDSNLNVVNTLTTPLIHSKNITKILPYDDNHVLISAYTDNLYIVNTSNMAIRAFSPENQRILSNAIDIMFDRDRNLWIGTYHHGLLRLDAKSGEIKSCLGSQTDDIVGLSQDTNGDIWASSSYGLHRFDVSGKRINTFLKPDGIGGNQFHEKCVTVTPQGNILFGGNAGLEEITPTSELKKSPPPISIPLIIKGLWSLPNYNTLLTDKNKDIAEASVKELALNHRNNSINIEYFATCYDRASELEYAYMLKGRDKDFINNGNYNRVSYSDLSAGDYEFYVKSRFRGGEWQQPVKLLDLKVTPSPWLATPAMVLYLLFAITIIITINRIYLRFKLIKQKYALSEERIEHEKRITANRINFFTNISHELRTPLTLICGPAKYLRDNHQAMTESQIKESFDFIDSNVERLLTLINQLLSFRRVNNETLPLQVAHGDIGKQLESLAKLYNIYATENRVTIHLQKPSDDSIMLTYDSDKVEKIVSNLIVNAIKYSRDNGDVTLSLDLVKKPAEIEADNDFTYARISVTDNGRGMKEEDIPKIFQPFKRLLGINGAKKAEGFGIGLHFVAHLVKEHKGIIRTVKNPEGGMTFTVIFPACDEAFSPTEFRNTPPDVNEASAVINEEFIEECIEKTSASQTTAGQPSEQMPEESDKEEESQPKMLVIDDNTDLNSFIAGLFSNKFEVFQASDGQHGLAIASEECPDIIISDVLMPGEVDGFEFCRKLKSEHSTSHIPVILLTAKILDEHKIQGYKCGADAYLCKPFSPDVLIACVNNLYTKRTQQASLILASAGMSDQPTEQTYKPEELSPLDKKFLEKLYAYIDNSLDNCELNVNMLGRELGFSRTNFYRKVKALTGISPNDLLRVYRLNRAAELLLTREYTVGEVGERTGFGNQSHFSSLFKKHFGVSPRAYVTNRFSQCTVTTAQ